MKSHELIEAVVEGTSAREVVNGIVEAKGPSDKALKQAVSRFGSVKVKRKGDDIVVTVKPKDEKSMSDKQYNDWEDKVSSALLKIKGVKDLEVQGYEFTIGDPGLEFAAGTRSRTAK
jgi:multidrug efflux pump subunit AcrB